MTNQHFDSIRQLLDRLSYQIVGPTCLHLKFEAYLVLSLTILTASNLQGLYKETFGLPGDYIYLFLTFLWLSRYLVFRWLATWDPSTNATPTLRGLASTLLTSLLYSGQTFDRPTHAVITKYLGTPSMQTSRNLYRLLPDSVLYLLQIIRVRLWNPALNLLSMYLPNINLSILLSPIKSILQPIVDHLGPLRGGILTIQQYAYSSWTATMPTLSFLVPLTTLLYYLVKLFLLFKGYQGIKYGNITGFSSKFTKEEEEASRQYGAYHLVQRPLWAEVFFYITAAGTIMSLMYYFRVILPIPDQVAGGNAIKDLRVEVKTTGKKGKLIKDNQDASWPERSRSIASDNRYRLSFHVRVIRMLESVFVCGILPRTAYLCRATGHCPEGAQLWELSRILYPIGITSVLRRDSNVPFGSMTADRTSAVWTVLSIAVVSLVLQLAQTVILNKTYLAIMTYVSNEWDLVEEVDSSNLPPLWDARRRYKKGDLVRFPLSGPHQSVYRATVNAPEARPSDLQLRLEQNLFRKELGHPATSNILSKASVLLCGIVVLHLLLCVIAVIVYGLDTAVWLSTALIAHLVAVYALVNTGVSNYSEINRLNAEICRDD